MGARWILAITRRMSGFQMRRRALVNQFFSCFALSRVSPAKALRSPKDG